MPLQASASASRCDAPYSRCPIARAELPDQQRDVRTPVTDPVSLGMTWPVLSRPENGTHPCDVAVVRSPSLSCLIDVARFARCGCGSCKWLEAFTARSPTSHMPPDELLAECGIQQEVDLLSRRQGVLRAELPTPRPGVPGAYLGGGRRDVGRAASCLDIRDLGAGQQGRCPPVSMGWRELAAPTDQPGSVRRPSRTHERSGLIGSEMCSCVISHLSFDRRQQTVDRSHTAPSSPFLRVPVSR